MSSTAERLQERTEKLMMDSEVERLSLFDMVKEERRRLKERREEIDHEIEMLETTLRVLEAV